MTTTTVLSSARVLLLLCSLGLLSSQDASHTPALVSVPALDVTAAERVEAGIEIRPRPLAPPDPTAVAALQGAYDYTNHAFTWEEHLARSDKRGFNIAGGQKFDQLDRLPCSVPKHVPWKTTLDALAKDTGNTWRMRQAIAEFIPLELAQRLRVPLDGAIASAGTRTDTLAWFAKRTGLTFKLDHSLGDDPGDHLRWFSQTASAEEWLNGFAHALGATALLEPDGTVVLYRRPLEPPLSPIVTAGSSALVYNEPPLARLDEPISIDFQDMDLEGSIRWMEWVLMYPITIDLPLEKRAAKLSLHVSEMKVRDAIDFVAKLGGVHCHILADRLLINEDSPKPPAKLGAER